MDEDDWKLKGRAKSQGQRAKGGTFSIGHLSFSIFHCLTLLIIPPDF
jgi:hypothetical protein